MEDMLQHISVQYKPINCTNEISFIYKPLTTQQLFSVILIYMYYLWTETCSK